MKRWWWTCVDCSMQGKVQDKDGDEAKALKRAEKKHHWRGGCEIGPCIRLDEIVVKK